MRSRLRGSTKKAPSGVAGGAWIARSKALEAGAQIDLWLRGEARIQRCNRYAGSLCPDVMSGEPPQCWAQKETACVVRTLVYLCSAAWPRGPACMPLRGVSSLDLGRTSWAVCFCVEGVLTGPL